MKYQIRKSVWESNSSSMHSLVVTKKNSNVRMTQEEVRAEFYLDEEWYKERHKNDEKEVIEIDPWENDFGRSPFSVLSSFRDKLYYAVAEYCGDNYRMESYLQAEKTFDEIFVPLLVRLIGCDEVKWDKWNDRDFAIYSGGGEYFDEVEEVPYEKLVYVEKEDRDGLGEDDLLRGHYRKTDIDGRPIEDAWFDVPDFGSIDHQSKGLLTGFLKSNNLSLEDYLTRKDIVVIITGDEYSTFSDMILCGLINKESIVTQYPDYINRGYYDEDTDEA